MLRVLCELPILLFQDAYFQFSEHFLSLIIFYFKHWVFITSSLWTWIPWDISCKVCIIIFNLRLASVFNWSILFCICTGCNFLSFLGWSVGLYILIHLFTHSFTISGTVVSSVTFHLGIKLKTDAFFGSNATLFWTSQAPT